MEWKIIVGVIATAIFFFGLGWTACALYGLQQSIKEIQKKLPKVDK